MREKREHVRANLDVNVQVTPKDERSWEVTSIDISRGGMFLGPSERAEIGTEVLLTFQLAGLGEVELPGFIRWTAQRGFGVQFGLLGARETHAIGVLVRRASTSMSLETGS